MSRMLVMSISIVLTVLFSASAASTRENIQSLDPKMKKDQRPCLSGSADRSDRDTAVKNANLVDASAPSKPEINRIRK